VSASKKEKKPLTKRTNMSLKVTVLFCLKFKICTKEMGGGGGLGESG
jgi:hypothetical protein